jgi:D-alanyl-D-alanine-carboxypeptidase/D-alanyl-D-alanine-endopeptidase
MNAPRLLVTSLSFALICTTLTTPALSQQLSEAWVKRAAAPLLEDETVDGLSIGYIEGEHFGIVHLGKASEAGQPANYSTLYEIGSITKVFTGILLADAVTRGEINLQAAVDIPNPAGIRLPSRDGRSIQWLDLSTHRSGLPRLPTNLASTGLTDPYRDYDSKLAAEFVNDYQLPRKPGESQEYSNFAASVLGYLIAAQAGKSYDELLQTRIAQPLGMTDTTISLSADQSRRLATPHSEVGSPTPPWAFADLPGAGGIRTTMRDMMRFARAQLNPPPGAIGEAIELAWKQHSAPDNSGPATGLGWMIAGDGQTRWHNGGTGGSSSAIFVSRQLKSAVIILSNTSARNQLEPLATKIILKAAGHEDAPDDDAQVQGTDDYPKRAPFSGVRWEGDTPVVKIGKEWVQLVSIDTVAAADVVAYCHRTYGDKWQKRFAEDLVEVLSGMGHEPKRTVQLIVQTPGEAATRTLEKVPMTEANRRAIRNAAPENAAPEIDPALRRRLVGRYQLAPDFIFTIRDREGHLMVGITNQPTQEVFPDSPTRWSYRGVDATLEFKLPRTGRAKSLVLHQNGMEQLARRID